MRTALAAGDPARVGLRGRRGRPRGRRDGRRGRGGRGARLRAGPRGPGQGGRHRHPPAGAGRLRHGRPGARPRWPPGRLVVVTDDVRDPGNAGTVLRTADAAGADAVVFCGGTVDPYNPKTVRSSAGSLFHVPLVVEADTERALAGLADLGYRRLGAVVRDGEDYAACDWSVPTALVLGNEAAGLRPGLALDGYVAIPMAGRAESLNVGMACAVLCFEALRQRRAAEAGVALDPVRGAARSRERARCALRCRDGRGGGRAPGGRRGGRGRLDRGAGRGGVRGAGQAGAAGVGPPRAGRARPRGAPHRRPGPARGPGAARGPGGRPPGPARRRRAAGRAGRRPARPDRDPAPGRPGGPGPPAPGHPDPVRAGGHLRGDGVHRGRGSRGRDGLVQLRGAQHPPGAPGPRHVRHPLPRPGRARDGGAAHPHLAGADPPHGGAAARPSTP